MQIQNTQSPNFQGIKMQSSRMSQKQKNLCDKFIDSITYSDSYIKSCDEDIDLYLLPFKNNKIKVCFVDKCSDMFYLNNNKKSRLQVEIINNKGGNVLGEQNKTFGECVASVESTLDTILNKNIKPPVYNYQKILNSKTDVAKLRPEHYQDMKDSVIEGVFDMKYVKNIDDELAPEILEF